MKKLIIGGVVVAFAAVAVPYVSGSMARAQFEESISKVNEAGNGMTFGYEVVSAGIYSSVVSLSAEIDPVLFASAEMTPAQQAMAAEFLSGDINLNLTHGPIVANDQATFGLAAYDFTKSWNIPETDTAVTAYMRGVIKPSYAGVVDMGVEPVTAEIKDKVSLDFSGLNVNVVCSSSECAFTGGTSDLSVGAQGQQVFLMKSMSIKGDMENNPELMYSGGLYDSEVTFEIASMSVPEQFSATNVGFDGASKLDDDTGIGSMSMTFRADAVDVAGQEVTDSVVSLEFNNLVNSALIELQKVSQSFSTNAAANEDAMSVLAEQIAVLLNEGIEINMTQLAMTMAEGSVDGESTFNIQSDQVNEALLANPGFWMSSVTGSSKLSVDMALAKKFAKMQVSPNLVQAGVDLSTEQGQAQLEQAAEMTIQQLVQMGIFVVEGDQLSLDYEKTATGQVINGKQM